MLYFAISLSHDIVGLLKIAVLLYQLHHGVVSLKFLPVSLSHFLVYFVLITESSVQFVLQF